MRAVAGREAVVHGFFWLVVANGVGVLLALLLLFPQAGVLLGEWTYGRWVPLHLNLHLFEWTSLPLVGWLLGVYGSEGRWGSAAVWGWSAALAIGAGTWLNGQSSGKIFVDWSGGALGVFLAALFLLWVVLVRGWWKGGREGWRAAGLVALLAVPGVLSGAKDEAAALWRAAWVFGIAGWIGSALGVGMGENLNRVPVGFVAAAWGLTLGGWWFFAKRERRLALPPGVGVLVVMAIGWVFTLLAEVPMLPADAVERGRKVYVAEGCLHCHSRYVRPGSRDELMWGPEVAIEELLAERPVLFGNRRQGPDLLQAGLRRSRTWLELKLRDPRALHGRSAMPGYGYLFEDGRGEDLLAFLGATRKGDFEEHLETVGSWEPEVETGDGLSRVSGAALFEGSCSMCHGSGGRGDGVLAKAFLRPPASLVEGPFLHILGEPGNELRLRVARIVKFGIPGTDMPGHEVLEDDEVLALADWVMGLRER